MQRQGSVLFACGCCSNHICPGHPPPLPALSIERWHKAISHVGINIRNKDGVVLLLGLASPAQV
jgi:hypothetical protein